MFYFPSLLFYFFIFPSFFRMPGLLSGLFPRCRGADDGLVDCRAEPRFIPTRALIG